MRVLVEAFGLTLLDLRVCERDEPESTSDQPPAHVSIGFCSTERSGPFIEDRQGLSEGTEERTPRPWGPA